MPFTELARLSPNFADAPANERLGVCFHHSVTPFEETIAHMLRPESQVSYHLLIAPDGTRARLVADEHLAPDALKNRCINATQTLQTFSIITGIVATLITALAVIKK